MCVYSAVFDQKITFILRGYFKTALISLNLSARKTKHCSNSIKVSSKGLLTIFDTALVSKNEGTKAIPAGTACNQIPTIFKSKNGGLLVNGSLNLYVISCKSSTSKIKYKNDRPPQYQGFQNALY